MYKQTKLLVLKKKLVAKPPKDSVVKRVAGNLSHLVPKKLRQIPTDQAIEMARDIMAKEIANE
jgi:hypothetical protein